MEKNPLLKLIQVSRYFGGLGAVVGLDLEVYPGEIVGLIGPNGAGKSTALNIIAGSLAPTQGRLLFKGEYVTGQPPHGMAARGLARVFQSNTLFQNIDVTTNVRVGLHLHTRIGFWRGFWGGKRLRSREEELHHEAMEILGFIGLANQHDKLALNLPHGSQRALCLGVALAVRPKLLLLDEPLTGMNAHEVDAMLSLIRALREKKGITSIIVEHNMRAVMGLCDRIAVLNYGKKIADGSPSVISEDPAVIEAYLGVEQSVA